MFNESKTQLIYFRSSKICRFLPVITFSDQVQHLGHNILSHNLSDTADILRVLKDMNRKANYILHFADPFVKSFLIHAYCLALYGCLLWSLSSKSIKLIEVAFNKILRKVWKLPCHSHTNIVHSVAHIF